MNSKAILQKLLDIASKQQKVLTKLAQAAQDPNIEYLRQGAQVAAANSGFNATEVNVTPLAASSGTGFSDNLVNIDPGYIVTVAGSPPDNKLRQKFIDTFKNQCRVQKPDAKWLDNLSISFK